MNLKKFYSFLIIISVLFSCQQVAGDETSNKKNTPATTSKPDEPNDYKMLFNPENLHEIEIEITQEEWNGLLNDMKIADNMKTGNYRKVKVIYKGPNSPDSPVEIVDAGFRTRGNTTRVLPEKNGNFYRAHFKIKFNEEFDLTEGSDEYKKRKDRRLFNVRELNLKAADDDSTLIREQFAYNFLNQEGLYAPKSSAAKLYITINGVKSYFGIYTAIESVDKSFLARRYGKDGNDGNLYKCLWQDNGPATLEHNGMSSKIGVKDWKNNNRPTYDRQTNDENSDYSDLLNFAKNINDLSGSSLKEYIDSHFAVDRFLKWVACNQLLGMPDDYWAMGNNYFIYFPNGTSDKIEFIPYDYDHGLGRGWEGPAGANSTLTASIYNWFTYEKYVKGSPLVTKLLAIDEYKSKYNQYLTDMTDPDKGSFNLAKYKEYFDKQYQIYKDHLTGTIIGDMYMTNDSTQEGFISNRIKSVRNQLGLSSDPIDTPSTQVDTSGLSITYGDGFEVDNDVLYASVQSGTDLKLSVKSENTEVTKVIVEISVYNKDSVVSSLTKTYEDTIAPFDFTINDQTYALDKWIINIKGLDDNNKEVSTKSSTIITYNKVSYQSPVKNSDGSYTFTFNPAEEFYNCQNVKEVYLSGDMNGWLPGDLMSLENSKYTVTKSNISSGNAYKFHVLFDDGSDKWFRDRVNKYTKPDDNFNSVVK